MSIPRTNSSFVYETREAESTIEIETWFHIVSSQAAANSVSDQMIASQVCFVLSPRSLSLQINSSIVDLSTKGI